MPRADVQELLGRLGLPGDSHVVPFWVVGYVTGYTYNLIPNRKADYSQKVITWEPPGGLASFTAHLSCLCSATMMPILS